MFCDYCGAKVADGVEYCPECGAKLNEKKEIKRENERGWGNGIGNGNGANFGNGGYVGNGGHVKEKNRPKQLNNGLLLSEGEIYIKNYRCCELSFPNVSGDLTVTNKRLIFSGNGTSSRVSKELKIDSVSGIDCHWGTNIRFIRLIIAILLVIAGIYLMGEIRIVGIITFLVGLILGALSFRKTFTLIIYGKDTQISPIALGEGATSIAGNSAIMSVIASPAKDTNRMLNEIGALIMDIQTKGDLAIEDWKEIGTSTLPPL